MSDLLLLLFVYTCAYVNNNHDVHTYIISCLIHIHVYLTCAYVNNSHYVHTCVDIVVTTEYIQEHLSTAISREVQDCTLKGWRPSCGGPDQLDSPSSERDVTSMRGFKSLLTVVQHCTHASSVTVSITAVLVNIMKGAYSQPIEGL